MRPISFPQQNIIYAKDQLDYIPLPAYRDYATGMVTSCWTFTLKERLRLLFGADLYWRQLTFNAPLQPIRPSLDFEVE